MWREVSETRREVVLLCWRSARRCVNGGRRLGGAFQLHPAIGGVYQRVRGRARRRAEGEAREPALRVGLPLVHDAVRVRVLLGAGEHAAVEEFGACHALAGRSGDLNPDDCAGLVCVRPGVFTPVARPGESNLLESLTRPVVFPAIDTAVLVQVDFDARDAATTGGATVVGEGSAGRQGSDAWAWLAKDPQGVSAGAGAGAGGAVEQDGALRSLAAVAGAASAGGAAAAQVEVRVPGTPALDVASLFELAGCPRGEGDGTWQAVEVRHRFSARDGFVTEVVARAA